MKKTIVIGGVVALAALATGVCVATYHHTTPDSPRRKRRSRTPSLQDDAASPTAEQVAEASEMLGRPAPRRTDQD